jgi:NAD dependent epimerase/dehydratase family enzyme
MKEFVNILGETLNKPTKVIIPITILRLMMGEVAEVLAKGKKVVPKRTLELGYKFKQEDLRKALENLLHK